MEAYKVVVTGPYAAGKSTFIRTVSDIEVVSTEAQTTLAEERDQKASTTVALDFGTIAITPDLNLYLFGTPGQQRFDFMWEVLSVGALGYIVLVDSCRPRQLIEAREMITVFEAITDAPYVIGATRQDDPTALPLSYIRRRLALAPAVPVVGCVATERESAKNVLIALVERMVARDGG